jgi:transposase
MIGLSGNAKILLCKKPINMNKSFEGLSNIVESIFKDEIISNNYFVFLNKKRDLMKVLYWDNDGLAIWYKRLEKGSFIFRDKNHLLNRREFFLLLEGVTPKKLQKRYAVNY